MSHLAGNYVMTETVCTSNNQESPRGCPAADYFYVGKCQEFPLQKPAEVISPARSYLN